MINIIMKIFTKDGKHVVMDNNKLYLILDI